MRPYNYLIISLLTLRAAAQSIPVGMTFYEDRVRMAQLTGEQPLTVSYCIRPVHHPYAVKAKMPFAHDNPFADLTKSFTKYGLLSDSTKGKFNALNPEDAALLPSVPLQARYLKGAVQAVVLPAEVRVRYNTHHPYGWQDGPMVPNVGLQTFYSVGAYAKLGPFEAQFRPEWVRAQNKPFDQPPIRLSGIDMPDQFGQDPYSYEGWGQSYLKFNTKQVGVGVSTENLWWGPGHYNSLLMTNNAPGFFHLTAHSNKPIKTFLGSVEFQTVSGLLKYSGFFPYGLNTIQSWPWVTAPIERNTALDNQRKGFTGIAVNFQPKWFPGLYVGVNRSIMTTADSLTVGSLAEIFRPVLKNVSGEDGGERNQLVSVYLRYVMPESHAEFYAEFGREDAAWDFEDLISDINHTRAYMLGFRKMTPLKKKDHWLMLEYEMTEIAQGLSSVARAYNYSWYVHGDKTHYSHVGQVLGAGIGPGGAIQTGAFSWFGPKDKKLTLRVERYEHNRETYYYRLPYIQYLDANGRSIVGGPIWPDISKRWIDFSGFLSYQQRFYGFIIQAQVQMMQTWNFNWQFDFTQPGNAFRQPGQNSLTPQFYLNAIYRL
jgi:hypothetical protein